VLHVRFSNRRTLAKYPYSRGNLNYFITAERRRILRMLTCPEVPSQQLESKSHNVDGKVHLFQMDVLVLGNIGETEHAKH
jgi:hypothetical protein